MRVGPVAPPAPSPGSQLARREGAAPPARTFLEVLGERQRTATTPGAVGAPPLPAPAAVPLGRGLIQVLGNVNAGQAKLDALLEAAARGKTFSAGELIALQATVFRYSQTVEVLSRATDKLVGAVKQTLGTQV